MNFTRGWLAALTAFAGVLGIILILDLTQYPFEVVRIYIFHYLLRTQDIAGSIVVIAIALAALLPNTRSGALQLVESFSRHPWAVAAAAFVFICAAARLTAYNHPLAGDEHLALFMSRAFAAGRLTGELPLRAGVPPGARVLPVALADRGRTDRARGEHLLAGRSRCCSRRSAWSARRGPAIRCSPRFRWC